MSLQNTPLQPHPRPRLLHVIANHALAHVVTPLPSACHCEPVRTLVWQSVTPQRNPASWHHFGQIRSTFPHSPKVLLSAMPHRKEYGLPRRFAPRNDMLKLAAWPHKTRALPVYCRKASLHPQPRPRPLRTLRAPRPCTRRNASVFCMSLRASALHPQKRCRLLHVIANQCAHWCGNPRPRRDTYQTCRTLGKFAVAAYSPGIVAFCFVLSQEMRIVPSLRSSQ